MMMDAFVFPWSAKCVEHKSFHVANPWGKNKQKKVVKNGTNRLYGSLFFIYARNPTSRQP